jgi:hypothetical protein
MAARVPYGHGRDACGFYYCIELPRERLSICINKMTNQKIQRSSKVPYQPFPGLDYVDLVCSRQQGTSRSCH